MVAAGAGTRLVLLSAATQLPPVLAMAALALALSVVTRNAVVGLAGPVLFGLASQLAALADLPPLLRMVLPAGTFAAWRGLWLDQPLLAPLWIGTGTSLAVAAGAVTVAAVVFLRRDVAVR